MKKLAIVLCAVVLAGCARTVEGLAVVEDPWSGQGQTSSTSHAPTSHAPTSHAPTPAVFDPCALDELTLKIAVGVDPASVVSVPGGCSWSGDSVRFAAMMSASFPLDSVETTAGVSDVSEIDLGVRTVTVFVFEGDTCVAIAEVDGGTLQLTMMEDEFSSSCITLRVAAQMLLKDV